MRSTPVYIELVRDGGYRRDGCRAEETPFRPTALTNRRDAIWMALSLRLAVQLDVCPLSDEGLSMAQGHRDQQAMDRWRAMSRAVRHKR